MQRIVIEPRLAGLFVVVAVASGCATAAAPAGSSPVSGASSPPASTASASGPVRGGALYDSWWKVKNTKAPTGDHPLWAERPDKTSSTVKGAGTWRCKECHGWDYKGVAGIYGNGSHKTGFAGIVGVTKSEAEIIDSLKNKHGYGAAGLSEEDLRDLAQFVRESAIDIAPMIDGNKAFTGDVARGKAHFDKACASCHGADGLQTKPKGSAGGFDEFPGKIASENPFEFQHKVRFGHPGVEMPPQEKLLTPAQLSELGAYAQSLKKAP